MGMIVNPYRFGVAASVMALDPANTGPFITLSNSNFTARKIAFSAWETSRSLTSRTAGKHYYEWTPDEFSGSFIAAGFATAASALNNYTGSATVSLGLVSNGDFFRNASSVASGIGAMTEGDVISMALDLDNDLVWFRRNGGNWNGSGSDNPATTTGGFALNSAMVTGSPAIYAAASVQVGPTDQLTMNLGQADFAYTPPSGFTAWG
jgi:hypothetical protein